MPRKSFSRLAGAAPATSSFGVAAPRWVDPLVLLFAGGALAATSWNRWADPFIDFGRELYIAWRLSEGAALYRDLAYFNGPLSPHWNAALFRLFGVSVRTLFAANMAVLSAVAALLYAGILRLYGRLAAVAGAVFFLAVFAFSQQLTVSSFDFVAPYSHEMTHGSLLGLISLAGLFAWTVRGGSATAALAGGSLGLALLGKPEFAIAVTGALLAGAAAIVRAGIRSRAEGLRWVAWAAVSTLLPPAAAWLLLSMPLGAGGAVDGLAGAWRFLGSSAVRGLAFYRQGIGIDEPMRNLTSAALWAAGIAGALALGAALALACRRRTGAALGALFLLSPGALLFAAKDVLPWISFARPLPFVLAGAILLQASTLLRSRPTDDRDARGALRLAVTVYALLLLLKMALNARLYQYGFALAMPGGVLAVAWLIGDAPSRLASWSSAPRWFRLWTLSLVAGVLAVQLSVSIRLWSEQNVVFAQGRDSLVSNAQARFHAMLAERLRARLARNSTLAVLPEGVMVNYLNRRVNPTPYVNFMPPELLMFGEVRIVDAFRASPPDYILLTNRDATDYGLRYLGNDWGKALMGWVQANYEAVEEIREPSSAGRWFSYGLLLRRKALSDS